MVLLNRLVEGRRCQPKKVKFCGNYVILYSTYDHYWNQKSEESFFSLPLLYICLAYCAYIHKHVMYQYMHMFVYMCACVSMCIGRYPEQIYFMTIFMSDLLCYNLQAVTGANIATAVTGPATDEMVQMTSVLYIWPVLDIHAGSYQCIASNVLGTSYSTKAVVTVSGKQAGLFLPITCVVPAFDESLGKCYYTICNYITMSFTCKQTFSRLYKHQHKDNSILHLLT